MMMVFAKLYGSVDYWAVLCAAIAQYMFSWVWYALLFEKKQCYWIALDKGVKNKEFIKERYGAAAPYVGHLFGAFLKVLMIVGLVALTKAATRCDYAQVGVAVGSLYVVHAHHEVWAQRPWTVLLIAVAYEIGAGLIASFVLFHATR
jgi:hypothetical protein